MSEDKIFARVEKLFDVGLLGDARILIVGCGSGGGASCATVSYVGHPKLYSHR